MSYLKQVMAEARKLLEAPVKTDQIISFLVENPAPDDTDMHAWAEKNGFEKPQAEQAAYALAGKFVNILTQGKGQDIKKEDIDPEEWAAGLKVETEHTSDPEIAEIIAKAHWAENKGYYLGPDKKGGGLVDWEKKLNGN